MAMTPEEKVRLLRMIGWPTLAAAVLNLGYGIVRLFDTTIVIDAVFPLVAGASLVALGIFELRAARQIEAENTSGEADY